MSGAPPMNTDKTMTIRVNHILIPARDRERSARFLADLLGLQVTGSSAGAPPGRFAVVQVDGTSLDFDTAQAVSPIHLALGVGAAEFEAILERLTAAGIDYSADPRHQRLRETNHLEGGRGLYFRDPDGHNIEILTRP